MSDTKNRIGFQLKAVNNLIKRKIHSTHPEGPDHCTGGHGWVIHYFYKNRDHDTFQRDFENHFSIRRSTATQMLKLMETHGLIEKEPVPYDARLKKIVLTDKALEIHKQIEKNINALEETLSRGITPEEKETFFRVIEKIKANLEV